MSDVVMEVRGLGKRYRIGERERYLALRDILTRAITAPFRRASRSKREYVWALRDINLDVHQGQVVGLIGRNGAGKTTLLKLLSRITRPTEGYAEVRGRVGSLLEVGTGFHPELTGRENVYLSGAILGMTRREIDRKFDDIVAFAGVERFLDTPLKHFSTGMQMRLAFAVAAHLEPEILLVDEVLAVGDLEFQKKCLGKMEEVSRSGRTIVFVSHQMNQIRRLCEQVFWLENGQIQQSGRTGEVIAKYEASTLDRGNAIGEKNCFLGWSICGNGNVIREGLREVTFHVYTQLSEPVTRGHFGFHVLNEAGSVLVSWGWDDVEIPAGNHEILVRAPMMPLRPGAYTIFASIYNRGNNLNGGVPVEIWTAPTPLIMDTVSLGHQQDRWTGTVNIPGQMEIR